MKKMRNNKQIKTEILKLIRKNPGIRPLELHQISGLEHSASVRDSLIKEGLVRKERKGAAVHYYPVSPWQEN